MSSGFPTMTGMLLVSTVRLLVKVLRNGWVQGCLVVYVAVLVLTNLESVLNGLLAIPLRAAEFAEEEDLGSRLAEFLFERARS